MTHVGPLQAQLNLVLLIQRPLLGSGLQELSDSQLRVFCGAPDALLFVMPVVVVVVVVVVRVTLIVPAQVAKDGSSVVGGRRHKNDALAHAHPDPLCMLSRVPRGHRAPRGGTGAMELIVQVVADHAAVYAQ